MRIFLLRHGRQSNKLCNANVSLAPEGRRQAELAGQRLLMYRVQALYSSHLMRAEETAQIINQTLQIPYRKLEGTQEICFGALENRSDAQNAVDFADFFQAYDRLEEDIPYPQGECGQDVFRRGIKALYEIIAEGEANHYETVALVTHGVWIRSMVAGLFGRDFTVKSLIGKQLENCSLTELVYLREKDRFTLERLNDYAHLEAEPALLRSAWRE